MLDVLRTYSVPDKIEVRNGHRSVEYLSSNLRSSCAAFYSRKKETLGVYIYIDILYL